MLFFGWFIVLIIAKWMLQTVGDNTSLINTLINIPLALGQASSKANTQVLTDADVQTTIQQMLLIIAAVCVPVMLLVKPIVLSNSNHSKKIQINSI